MIVVMYAVCVYVHVHDVIVIALLCDTYTTPTHRGEVVVSAGDKEAITCTDIGELLSSCHQYCVNQ